MRTIPIAIITVCCLLAVGESSGQQVQRMLGDSRFSWTTIEAPDIRIHFPAGSYAETQKAQLVEQAQTAKKQALSRLGIDEFDDKLTLLYVDSRSDMRELIGQPATGFAYHEESAVVLVFNADWRPFERHEMAHVFTMRSWDNPGDDGAIEGIATFADGDCGGFEIARVARTMLDLGVLLNFDMLSGTFRSQDDLIAYIQAGAVIEYTSEQRPKVGVRRLWSEGLRAAPDILGIPVPEFERRFREWLRAGHEALPEQAWLRIRAGGCGINARSPG